MWEKYLGLLNVSGLCHVHYSIPDKLNVIRALANRFLFSSGWNTNDWEYSLRCARADVNWSTGVRTRRLAGAASHWMGTCYRLNLDHSLTLPALPGTQLNRFYWIALRCGPPFRMRGLRQGLSTSTSPSMSHTFDDPGHWCNGVMSDPGPWGGHHYTVMRR